VKKGSNEGKIAAQTTTNWTFNKQNDHGLCSFYTLTEKVSLLKNFKIFFKNIFDIVLF